MMERLTNKKEADAQRHDYENRLKNGYPRNIPEERFLRLAAYEDTELTPGEVRSLWGEWNAMMSVLNSIGSYDRLRELAEADKNGRLLVLLCKVGDTVWFVLHDSPCFYPETSGWYIEETKVTTVTNEGFCDGEVDVDGITPWGELGKTVFLTREEAEAALEEAKKDG